MIHRSAIVVCALLALYGPADAATTNCLPFPLPTTPQPPVFTLQLDFFGEHGQAQLWRQACEDGTGDVAILMRVTPTAPTLFVCPMNFEVTQAGAVVDSLVTATPGDTSPCDVITAPTTFLLVDRGNPKTFRERSPFSLTHHGAPTTFVQVTAPSITVAASGCTTCSVGQTLAFTAHVTNPGPAMAAQIKAGVRFPDGTVLRLFDIDRVLGAGAVFDLVMIPNFVLPPGIAPPGVYVVEAAILEPGLGLLWSRASTRMVVQ